ncbi:S8 family serine peptidase [Mesobacillus foraminis]|uniref:S8 family serine peptidase n=1 Tax=Mesobacillus foraminis TaxID=279826 RepID=UPI001BE684DC|nr:S8 family serine peptidase [Mesobacillus foraminis]MBT2756687.1 S8 family serine peptidase [Mesobacillus foraminis]
MRLPVTILLSVFCCLLSVSAVSANSLEVEPPKPKISKFQTRLLFDDSKEYNSRQVIVKFKKNASPEIRQEILESIRLKELDSVDRGDFILVSSPKGYDLASVAASLLNYQEIEYVEPNYRVEAAYTPSDPGYKKQWYLGRIQAPKAWDQTKGASNITVAIIDGGVQTSHPELKGKIVAPYNVVTGKPTLPADHHGTHVAGIIAASFNKAGTAGVAPNIKIMPINVFSGEYADTFDIASAVYYAADHQANVINMSLGSYYYSAVMKEAVAYARTKGAVVVAAAGNEDLNFNTYPAAFPNVIGVSALNKDNKITIFSNYGRYIDFAAPGIDIYSTVAGGKYNTMDGTSMAAPQVSGVAALVLSKNPLLSPAEVESILKNSSVDLGSKGRDNYYGYGRIDAYRALQKTPSPVSVTAGKTFNMSGSNRTYISVTAKKGSTVSMYVQNSKGTTIKTLVKNKKSTGSKISASWDGKQDNGTYAGDGSYKIVAKATNGRETASKSTAIKVADKIKPVIKLGTSALYSPTAQGKLTISYELSEKAAVTATVYDKNNKAVQRLLKKTESKGKKSFTWDGRNSKNQRVSDGTYKLVMTSKDSYKNKGTNKQMSIVVDTKKPEGKAVLPAPIFKMDGKLQDGVKLTFKEKVTVKAVYATNAKGTKVKKLATNKTFTAGTHTFKWDGKNDKGALQPEGKYSYLAEFKDAAGNKASVKSGGFDLQDWQQKPVVSAQLQAEYRNPEAAEFEYTLSKPGKVTVQLYRGDNVVKTIVKDAVKPAGSHTFTWDGKGAAGKLLEDGDYTFKITATNRYNPAVANSFDVKLKVALTRPEIKHPGIAELYPGDMNPGEVLYELSEPATVLIDILDPSGESVGTLEKTADKGINSFQLNEFMKEGSSFPGDTYTYVVKAINSVKNEVTAKGVLTLKEAPDWLTGKQYSFTNNEADGKTALNLKIATTEDAAMQLYVYDAAAGELLESPEPVAIKAGTNDYSIERRSEENIYYVLGLTDSLGNSYFYKIEKDIEENPGGEIVKKPDFRPVLKEEEQVQQ